MTGDGQAAVLYVQRRSAVTGGVVLISSQGVSGTTVLSLRREFSRFAVLLYFCRGLCIALTIGLFVAIELAMLFPVLARATTDTAHRERPTLLVDAYQWSIFEQQTLACNLADLMIRPTPFPTRG